MRRARLLVCLISPALLLVTACYVPNRSYRPVASSFVQVTPSPTPPIDKPPVDGEACTSESLLHRPCLVFLEFDDMGEQWTNDNRAYTSALPAGWEPHDPNETQVRCASQLCNAIAIVREATRLSMQQGTQAIIVTFTHGWKHNARSGDTNIDGFKQAINKLREIYPNRIIVGVFISWRGDLVPDYMPVRRTFTYFNREAAATRIPGASVTDALIRIADTAHNMAAPNSLQRPFVVFVGHSFGALFMERALSQAAVRQMDTFEESGGGNYRPLADIVILVNSAAAATEAKQTLDFLAANKFEYHQSGDSTSPSMPLILSVSSSGDIATRFAMPIGHGLPFLDYKIHGSFREQDPLTCYSPGGTNFPLTPAPSQSAFFMSTAAHMQILQSHQLVSCDQPAQGQFKQFVLPDDPSRCFRIEEKPGRCNGTPYWIMEIDPSIVPDHSTIFTARFISFLIRFLPTQADMDDNNRPTLTKVQ